MKKILIFFGLLVLLGCRSSILDDPTTDINFSTPERSHVKITVVNSYDTEIAVLFDGERGPGSHTITFQTDDLAEGIYFYILEARGLESDYYYRSKRTLLLVKP